MLLHDWFILAGWACLILAVFVGIAGWASNLVREAKSREQERREQYQDRLNEAIIAACDDPDWEDTQWLVHSRLYEYRHATSR
jgi:hypothetical protein